LLALGKKQYKRHSKSFQITVKAAFELIGVLLAGDSTKLRAQTLRNNFNSNKMGDHQTLTINSQE
jgi:hypothetical protein